MKLKELLDCVSKLTVIRFVVDHEWVCDTNGGNSKILESYYNHCVDKIGIDGDTLFIGVLSETGGIS